MGRPLNKKYFGNRNIGTGGAQGVTKDGNGNITRRGGDDGIGGEGVGSYGTIVAGSGWTAQPTVTFSPPDIPGGVNVAGTVHYKALSFATTANGSGYDVGDVLEVHTGTASTKARAPVATIVVVGTPTKNDGGSGYADGDLLTFSGAGWSTPLILRVNRPGGGTGTPDNFTVTQAGIRTVAAPTNPVSYTSRTGSGNGCTVDITWGVYSFGAVTVPGDYTVFPSTSGQLDSVTPATGTGATATITMGLLSVAITEKGSGYTSPADAAIGFSGSTGAAATAVLTTDSGGFLGSGNNVGTDQNAATNQENAIIIHANTTGSGTKIGDIIKQKGSSRYQVRTADGIATVKLVASDTPAIGEAYITATDHTTTANYWVTKLTAHRATIYPKGDGTPDFPLDGPLGNEPQHVGWTFGTATAPSTGVLGTVKIENA